MEFKFFFSQAVHQSEHKTTPVRLQQEDEDDLDLDLEGVNIDDNIDTTVRNTGILSLILIIFFRTSILMMIC